MNLIKDRWIPAIRRDGTRDVISIAQIADTENPVITINYARADFRAASLELIIGILAIAKQPQDNDEWVELYENRPTTDELDAILAPLSQAIAGDDPEFHGI